MQNPHAFTSLPLFLRLIAQTIRSAVPAKSGAPDTLPGFFDFLTTCNDALQKADERLLLAIDEYETIDQKIGEVVFPEDLLASIRQSIQSHRDITWIFAGSH